MTVYALITAKLTLDYSIRIDLDSVWSTMDEASDHLAAAGSDFDTMDIVPIDLNDLDKYRED